MKRVSDYAVLLLLLAPVCQAQDLRSEIRLGAGVDVVHKDGMAMASAAAGPFSFLLWGDNFGGALTYNFGRREGLNAGVGAILAARTDEDVGTHGNALLRASYCGRQVCVSFAHISHGSDLGIEKGKANDGLNFLYLEYRLR